jgi:hypothetical protein
MMVAAMKAQQKKSDSLRAKSKPHKKRKVKNGKPSNELVLSAYMEGNDSVFSRILGLYVIEIVQPEEADPALIATLHDMLTSAKAGISGFNQRAQKY